jgi:hypothetical protein
MNQVFLDTEMLHETLFCHTITRHNRQDRVHVMLLFHVRCTLCGYEIVETMLYVLVTFEATYSRGLCVEIRFSYNIEDGY